MVIVVDGIEKRERKKAKLNLATALTEIFFNTANVKNSPPGHIAVTDTSDGTWIASINPRTDSMVLHDREYLDISLRFGREYEIKFLSGGLLNIFGKKFTIETNYS